MKHCKLAAHYADIYSMVINDYSLLVRPKLLRLLDFLWVHTCSLGIDWK